MILKTITYSWEEKMDDYCNPNKIVVNSLTVNVSQIIERATGFILPCINLKCISFWPCFSASIVKNISIKFKSV